MLWPKVVDYVIVCRETGSLLAEGRLNQS